KIGSFYEFAEVKPRGNCFSFLRDSWFQGKPSTPRVPRWCSRLAGHGEAGTTAVLARRWPGHCRFLILPPGPSVSSRALGLVASTFVRPIRVGTTFYPF